MKSAESNIRKSNVLAKLIDSGRLQLVMGDGRKGYEQQGPYDAIHVGAASPQEPQAVSLMGYNLYNKQSVQWDIIL